MKKLLTLLVVATMLATTAFCAFSVSADSTNLALNKGYTGAEPSTHPNNVNYTAKLTDGNVGTELSLDPGAWFAYYCNESANEDQINAPDHVGQLVIDLEKVSSVESIRIHMFLGSYAGILPPHKVTVAVSNDGTNFTPFGEEKTFTAPEAATGTDVVDWVNFSAAAVDARYVQITINLNGVFAFLDEVEVYGTVKTDDSGNTETSSEENKEESKDDSKDDSKEESKDEGKEESSTSTPSTSDNASSETSKPTTGDAGMLIFAVLAVFAVAGSVVAIRARH